MKLLIRLVDNYLYLKFTRETYLFHRILVTQLKQVIIKLSSTL